MDIYEIRRLRLLEVMKECCNNKAVELAKAIERSDSYVTRMLYPEGKAGKKRIGEDMARHVAEVFNLPAGWLEGKDVEESTETLEKVTPEASAVAHMFDKLNPAQQKAVWGVLEGFGATPPQNTGSTSAQAQNRLTTFQLPAQGTKQSSRSS